MSDVKQVFPLQPIPGIQRDGTNFDIQNIGYIDGKWVRFQRGRPRKMGGYIRISDKLSGPVRKCLVTPYDGTARILTFSTSGIESILVDSNGLGASIVDRTPSGFTKNPNFLWSCDEMYDDASGAGKAIVLAVAVDLLDAIDSTNVGQVYYGNVFDDTAFAAASGITARGLFVAEPYAIYYGNSGNVTWSNVNEPLNITTGDAGSDRVTRDDIVAGLSIPSGTGPAGLLFSLSSVIRMEFVGGQAIFRFTRLTNSSSILSQNSVVELDGVYYWAGTDKFYVSDGSQVTTLPNATNLNYFFDNINRANTSKVWATKNKKFNEIIWYYPRGENTECSHAIVYNIDNKCWYDYELSRTAGSHYNENPVKTSADSPAIVKFTLDTITGNIDIGDIIQGDTSTAKYEVILIQDSVYYGEQRTIAALEDGEDITNTSQSGSSSLLSLVNTCSAYLHEFGVDAVEGENQSAIESYFTMSDIGLVYTNQLNNWTRLIRLEPDFIQSGDISLSVISKEFANSPEVVIPILTFSSTTEKADMRIQARHLYLKFESNVAGGDYQLGRCLVHIEAGDMRS